jgi:kynurenine formamidase
MYNLPRKVYDLAEPLYHNCPSNPAFPPFEMSTRMLHVVSGWCAEELRMATHVGTHLDAPYHRLAEGKKLDELSVERLVCPAVCVDATGVAPGAPIGVELLRRAEALPAGGAVLFRTGWGDKRAMTDEYLNRSPWVSDAAARWLVERGLAGAGIDHFSIGGTQAPNVTVPHDILLGAGLWILEGLQIPAELTSLESFLLVVAPLRLLGTGGAPARAYALDF